VKPLRVVHAISSPAAGGAEVYVKDLATQLARGGHRPAVLFLSRSADIGRGSAFEEGFLADLDASGIPYAFLGHECRRNPLLGMFRTRRFARSQRADIYHSHLKYSLLFGPGLGRPHVHTHHNVRRQFSPMGIHVLSTIFEYFTHGSDRRWNCPEQQAR
jgi:hypothetical protein